MPLGMPSSSFGSADAAERNGFTGGGGGLTDLLGGRSNGGTNLSGSAAIQSLVPPSSSSTPVQNPYTDYLRNAMGMSNKYYDLQMDALGNGFNQSGTVGLDAARRNAAVTNQGINNDLLYGGQLRGESRFRDVVLGGRRNDQDLWRANQTWQNLQADLGNRSARAGEFWRELQRNNMAGRGFAGRGRDLSLADIGLTFDRSSRQATTDATARGARTSAGFVSSLDEFGQQRDIGTGQANLDYDRVIENLTNQFNQGKIGYQQALDGINAARAAGKLSNTDANKTYGINRDQLASTDRTYGIQGRQAQADVNVRRQSSNTAVQNAQSAQAAARADALAQIARQRAVIEQQKQLAAGQLYGQLGSYGYGG